MADYSQGQAIIGVQKFGRVSGCLGDSFCHAILELER